MKTTVMLALGLVLLGTSTAAFATTKTHTTTTKTPTHHCQLQGTEVPKSKKACVKAGGTWEPGAPGAKSAAAPAATTK